LDTLTERDLLDAMGKARNASVQGMSRVESARRAFLGEGELGLNDLPDAQCGPKAGLNLVSH